MHGLVSHLTIPVTVASGEEFFSKLKLLQLQLFEIITPARAPK